MIFINKYVELPDVGYREKAIPVVRMLDEHILLGLLFFILLFFIDYWPVRRANRQIREQELIQYKVNGAG